MTVLRLGTRGSQLALWQARAVAAEIQRHGGPACELCVIKTAGDRLAQESLSQIGGKRLFVKEIEDALLQGDIDLAVHSAKDMPAVLPDGLAIGSVLPRDDPHDGLVLPHSATAVPSADLPGLLAWLGQSPRVGTSSVRRVAQLARLFPSASFQAVRGNLDTRLRKLDAGDYDLLALAAAGLRRLGFAHRISATLPVSSCVPAPGQGAIAVEIRASDGGVRALVAATNDPPSMAALTAERALVIGLGGGCQVPIGAVAATVGTELELHALVTSLDGVHVLRRKDRGPAAEPEALGARVAGQLKADGAEVILEQVRRAHAPVEGIQP